MCLGNQHMFLSITNFQEPGVSQHEPRRQHQEREVNGEAPFPSLSDKRRHSEVGATMQPLFPNRSSMNRARAGEPLRVGRPCTVRRGLCADPGAPLPFRMERGPATCISARTEAEKQIDGHGQGEMGDGGEGWTLPWTPGIEFDSVNTWSKVLLVQGSARPWSWSAWIQTPALPAASHVT